MGVFKKLIKVLSFEERESEFELLETERGEPGFLGGWRKYEHAEPTARHEIPASLSKCRMILKKTFNLDINPDVNIRDFMLGGAMPALAVFMTGMADSDLINDYILRDGMHRTALNDARPPICEYAIKNIFTMGEAEISSDWAELLTAVTEGRTAVLFEGEGSCVIMDTRGFEHRSVDSPQNEKTVKGPQEGFSESIRTNVTLIRRIIKTEDLVCEFRKSGGSNKTKVAVLYRAGVTNETLIAEVKRRLARVEIRTASSSGILEQMMEEHNLSPFPQLLSTERPDRTARYIMEGHVAVLVEGSPFANVMPVTLHSLMTSPEDNYLREPQGTIVRAVRYVGVILSILLPGYFLSLALHHQGLLSVEVLSTLVSSRQMVFAPLGGEMVFLLVVFQLIREAGLRVPGSIGQAIGIIGGLILGQAAVAANLASSVVLIIVALSGLGNFCVPDYSTQIAAAYFRLAIVLAAWLAGLLGIACAVLLITAWTCSLKSYGTPFLSPFSPKTYSKYPLIRRGRILRGTRATDFTNTVGEKRV